MDSKTTASSPKPSLPRIAWFSPLNSRGAVPSSSVAAFYSDQVLEVLKEQFSIEAFTDTPGTYDEIPTYHHNQYAERAKLAPFSLNIYQIEDHPQAAFVLNHTRDISKEAPSVTILHDYLFRSGDKLDLPNLSLPNVGVLVFTSERNLDEYKRSETSPSPTRLFPFPIEIGSTKPRPNILTIGYTGSPHIPHRAHKILAALSELSLPYELNWLINTDEQAEAARLLTEFSIKNAALLPDRSPAKWQSIAPSCTLALHTLFSAHGDLTPYLELSLAAGVPAIVTNFSTAHSIPDALVTKTRMGEHEVEDLVTAITKIGTQSEEALKIFQESARGYLEERNERAFIAKELANLLKHEL